ncbi:hypothetical protein K9L63_02470 [Candidatus Gracilibacteria bacterium]|nr:hypothetical protein [Candidatus Gracilibacteria bacterium]
MNDDKNSRNSFLAEAQQEGRASGKVEITDLDQAIAQANVILDEAVVSKFRTTEEENLPTVKITVYCHDCRQVVPAGIGKTLRGNPRTVCGTCKSKKVSMGTEEALCRFYHLDKEQKKEEKERKK